MKNDVYKNDWVAVRAAAFGDKPEEKNERFTSTAAQGGTCL